MNYEEMSISELEKLEHEMEYEIDMLDATQLALKILANSK